MRGSPVFAINAIWDADASMWVGHCDEVPAAADAATLDELFEKVWVMARDLLPDNHPDLDPATLSMQLTARRRLVAAGG